ncbi:MAG: baseplate J/gp47 family protein [Paracraurococcus sp.]
MPADAFAKRDYQAIVAALLDQAGSDAGGRAAVTDANAGSVVRTLMEAFARELAVCYEQLDIVWRAAYLETAEGQALDNVVALLGLERRRGGFLVGAVEFSRAQPAEADIAIPAGTLVAGRGVPLVQTTQAAVLPAGQTQVRVDVQSVEPSADGKSLHSSALTLMPRPIAGIESVRNSLDLVQRVRPEGDAELRARAAVAVRRAHTGTVASLESAVRGCGIDEVRVIEDPVAAPAMVTVVIGDTDVPEDVLAAAYAAVREVRPAGVRVTVNRATPIAVRIEAVMDLTRDATPAEQQSILDRVRGGLAAYVGQLAVGEMLRVAKLRAVLTMDDRVASAEPGESGRLIDPYVKNVSIGARALLMNGDLQVGPSERVVLQSDLEWPKLSLRVPGLRIDADIVLPQAEVARIADLQTAAADALAQMAATLRQEMDKATRLREGGGTGALPVVAYDKLLAALPGLPAGTTLRVTVVHERDGRVAVLSAAGQSDTLAAGELARAGAATVRLAA